jgi:hypothetical protein
VNGVLRCSEDAQTRSVERGERNRAELKGFLSMAYGRRRRTAQNYVGSGYLLSDENDETMGVIHI